MAGRVLCIELGSALTKVCEMDLGKANPSVYDSFMFETPDGTLSDGYIKGTDAFKVKFKEELAARKINTNKVIFTIYSNKIATREAKIPLVKNDKILSVIQANSSDYFPIDLTGYQLGYTVLERINTKDEKQLRISIVAAPVDLLQSYLVLADAMGMDLEDIDFAGNSIYQALKDTSVGIQVSIHLNEYSTLISMIDGDKLLMQRSISYGTFDAIEAVKSLPDFNNRAGFGTMDAIQVLTDRRIIDSEFSDNGGYAATGSPNAGSAIVTETLRPLIGNVGRVIDYFLSKNQGAEIVELKLTGLGSQFQGMNDLFANEIGIKTRQIIAVPSVSFEQMGSGSKLPVMLMAIGANLAPMGLVPDGSGKERVSRAKKGSIVLGVLILLVCLGISGVLFAVGSISLAVNALAKANLESKYESETYIESVKAEYEAMKKLGDNFNLHYNATENFNEDLNAFIEEMEEKMPKDIITIEAYADVTGVVLDVRVHDKSEAADVIHQFKNFDSITVTKVEVEKMFSGFQEEESEESSSEGEGPVIIIVNPDESESESESIPLAAYEMERNVTSFEIQCVYGKKNAE